MKPNTRAQVAQLPGLAAVKFPGVPIAVPLSPIIRSTTIAILVGLLLALWDQFSGLAAVDMEE